MRNIRLFDEYNDFLATQESVSGSGKYVEDIFPGFAYIRENFSADTYAFYNGHEEESSDYHFGDVIYLASDNTLKSVYWTGYTPSMGEKVGLIVVPTSHAADGNARMIAFENAMSQEEPGPEMSTQPDTRGGDILLGEASEASDNVWDYLFEWYNTNNGGMMANGILCWDVPSGVGKGPEDNYLYYVCNSAGQYGRFYDLDAQFSSDFGNNNIQNPMSENESYYRRLDESVKPETRDGDTVLGAGTESFDGQYYNEGLYLGVSPYMTDGSQNPNYVEREWDDSIYSDVHINAFADWAGYANTNVMGDNEAISYVALRYNTPGTNAGDWYVGAMGEMGYVSSRLWAIEYIMNQLGGDPVIVSVPGSTPFYAPIYTSTEEYSNPMYDVYRILAIPNEGGNSPSEAEETYPADSPSPTVRGTVSLDISWGNTTYNVDGSVRPMAMIKEGQIQHGEVPNGPVTPFEEPEV